MSAASAPSQLPFAPRPFPNELFSSWMLRIADANCISLQELMFGFQSCHPDVPCPNSLDWGFSTAFLKAMARFCRAPAGTLRSLDLRTRLPKAQKVLLLHFRAVSDDCLRCRKERVGYAFCTTCIAQQRYVHARWEWAFPALLFCHVHNSPLRHGCPMCGEDDPLPFGAPAVASILFWLRSGFEPASVLVRMSGALIGPTLSSKRSTVPLCAEPPLIMRCWATSLRRSFVASSTTFSNCLPGTQARSCPHPLQTRGICISLLGRRFLPSSQHSL